jgi:hypothetical protein
MKDKSQANVHQSKSYIAKKPIISQYRNPHNKRDPEKVRSALMRVIKRI